MAYRIVFLVFSLFLISCKTQDISPNKEISVLFVGNSLTYYNDMPQMLQSMLNETHPHIKVHQSTFPGMQLNGHLEDIIISKSENRISTRKKKDNETSETENKIKERKWDIVISQTGGATVLDDRKINISNAISNIKTLVNNPNCKFILFNTWISLKDYTKQSSMNKLKDLNQAYEDLAEQNNLITSNNGNKFYELTTNYPNINLYEDNIHPNKNGSFLNACVFYELITNSNASNLKYNSNIDSEIATLLKEIAH